MADEKVNIVVKVITKTKQLDALLAKLKAVEAMESRLSSGKNVQKYAQGAGAALTRATSKWKKHFDFVDSAIRMFGKGLTGFLKFAIKGVLIEMGLLAASMVGWHALVKGGQYIVKAYHGTMQLLAGGAAGLTVALATASAAIREQQAAMYAYRGKGAPQFKTSMNQTVMAMRNLQMDADLASLGIEALNSAFASMSKTMSSTQINASGKSIKALMDFGSAGQDPKKAVAQVGTIVAALEDEKKSVSNVLSEAKKLGPEMEKALKDANIKTKKQFKELLFSGELAKKGGVLGQFEATNTTLISELTRYFNLLRGEFADFGMQFLKPAGDAFERIFNVIKTDMKRIILTVQSQFGSDGMFKGLADTVEKLSNWMVKTIRQYLPGFQGMFKRIGEWMSNFKRGWDLVLERLRPLIDGARVIEKAFGQVWQAIKDGTENMGHMRELLLANESTVIETGTRIGDLIRDISDLFFRMKTVFFEILPFLNDVLSGIGMLIRGMTKLLTGLGGSGGGFLKALAPLLAFQIFGKRMMGASGKMMPGMTGIGRSLPFSNLQNMPIQAQNVYVNGQQVSGGAPQISNPAASNAQRVASGAAPMGTGGVPMPVYGPAVANRVNYSGPYLSRIYGTTSAHQLQDFSDKHANMGYRGMKDTFTHKDGRQYGSGIAQAQSQYNAGPSLRATMMLDPATGMPMLRQNVADTDFVKTQATTAAYAGTGMHSAGGAPVYADTRHLGGVYVNERGIPLTYSQNSQNLLGRIQVDDRMRLSEAMRVGRMAKSGFERADLRQAGFDRRAYERQLMFNTPGAGMITPSIGTNLSTNYPSTTYVGGRHRTTQDLDYSRMGDKRLARLARGRGIDTSGGTAAVADRLRQQDVDRQLAHRVVAGDRSAQFGMSSGFREGEFKRWQQEVKDPNTGKPTGEIRYRDPGLTMRERLTRSGMRARTRIDDAAASVGARVSGAAGSFQGMMGYANSGRFDASLNDGKGDFVNIQKMRQEALQRMKDAREQQNRGKFSTRLSYAREMMRISRSETKFGAASKRFAQSGTGRMGTSMGLGLASQYAPEEMRGAIALGGMVSTIDPRLGLAVAGVGGALKARSAGTGAAAGAVGGAAIGQYFGPYGALIGTAIGTLVGAISGAVNKGKYELQEAKESAQQALASLYTGIAERASRTFTITREMQDKGLDISKRNRAFSGFGRKVAMARLSMSEQLLNVGGVTQEQIADANTKLTPFTPTGDAAVDYVNANKYLMESGQQMKAKELAKPGSKKMIDFAYENQTRLGLQISEDQYEKMKKNPMAAAGELTDITGNYDKVVMMMDNIGDARFAQLAKDTGKSQAELELLAQELGVNLYDATTKYRDLAVKMGAALVKTAGQLNNEITDLMLATGDKFRKKRERREAEKAINFSAQGLRDKFLSKDATDEEKEESTDAFFENYAAQQIAATGGNAFAAYEKARLGFGQRDPKTGQITGGTAFQKGGVFSGMGGTRVQTEGIGVADEMRTSIEKTYAQQLGALAQASGYSIDAGILQKQMEGMTDAQLKALSVSITSEDFDYRDSITGETNQKTIEETLTRLGFNMQKDKGRFENGQFIEGGGSLVSALNEGILDPFVGDMEKIAKQMGIDYQLFKTATGEYIKATDQFFKGTSDAPNWWKKGLKATGSGNEFRLMPEEDTSSPRGGQIGDTTTSKLSQTMARHQAMDGQLTGKRTVTSSWRNHSLGSSNSDHVTGRAYDLVGQNLGKYATMVHANGGFAEFHGNLAERHLHVVPGPVPGVGDTPVPANYAAAAPMANSPAAEPGKYTININGANASPEAIANMVVARLDDRERKYRER